MGVRKVTPEEVKAAMISKDIKVADHHECGFCGRMVKYYRDGENLSFDPRCGCTTSGHIEPREWSEPASWINMQSVPKCAIAIAAKFGLELKEE